MGYYQIKMDPDSIYLTSFIILNQQFEFLRMPFGLSNAPRTFQAAMLAFFRDFKFVKVYLDDILVHSKSEIEHYIHLIKVLNRLKESNISLKWSKTHFCKPLVVYLGHEISAQGIRADTSRIDSFKIEAPRTKKQLMRTIGILQRFQPFLKNASEELLFITNKLNKNLKLSWSETDTQDLIRIVDKIKARTILSFPNWNAKMELETDASLNAVGGVLFQNSNIIGFFSAKLTESERSYSIPEKEFLAIYKSLTHFKTLVFGVKIHPKVDNKNIPEELV